MLALISMPEVYTANESGVYEGPGATEKFNYHATAILSSVVKNRPDPGARGAGGENRVIPRSLGRIR